MLSPCLARSYAHPQSGESHTCVLPKWLDPWWSPGRSTISGTLTVALASQEPFACHQSRQCPHSACAGTSGSCLSPQPELTPSLFCCLSSLGTGLDPEPSGLYVTVVNWADCPGSPTLWANPCRAAAPPAGHPLTLRQTLPHQLPCRQRDLMTESAGAVPMSCSVRGPFPNWCKRSLSMRPHGPWTAVDTGIRSPNGCDGSCLGRCICRQTSAWHRPCVHGAGAPNNQHSGRLFSLPRPQVPTLTGPAIRTGAMEKSDQGPGQAGGREMAPPYPVEGWHLGPLEMPGMA